MFRPSFYLCCGITHTAGPLEGPQECPWGSETLWQGSWCATQPHQALRALQGKEIREGSWQEEQPWIQGLSRGPCVCCCQHSAAILFDQSTVISNYFLPRVVAQLVALVWIFERCLKDSVAFSALSYLASGFQWWHASYVLWLEMFGGISSMTWLDEIIHGVLASMIAETPIQYRIIFVKALLVLANSPAFHICLMLPTASSGKVACLLGLEN